MWLNEGFATYVSYLGANFAEPNWNMVSFVFSWTPLVEIYANLPGLTTVLNAIISFCVFQKDLIVLNEITGVMSVDALASSHPLSSKEEDIMTPEDISQLFDSITYSKVLYL